MALVFWALHACSALLLAIAVRGCPDECHTFAVGAAISTSLLGSVVVTCGGLAAWRWWNGDREPARSRGLLATCLIVGVALLAAAVLALTGVLEDVIEGALGISLQPGSWEDFRTYHPPTGVTFLEVVAAAYTAGVGVISLAGAMWIRSPTRPPADR